MPHSSRTVQKNKVTVPPAGGDPVVTLVEAKAHSRVLSDAEDGLITSYIAAATLAVEKYLTRKLITQTIVAFMDEFPAVGGGAWWDGLRQGTPSSTGITSDVSIHLDLLPVQSVSEVAVFNDADVETVFSATEYRVDDHDSDLRARISLVEGGVWPSDLRPTNAVKITYVVGYGAAVSVPEDIKLAIKELVGHWCINREAVSDTTLKEVPLQYRFLIDQYKQMNLG